MPNQLALLYLNFFMITPPWILQGQAFKPIDSIVFTIMAKISEKQFNSNTCFTSIYDLQFKTF